MTDNDLKPAQEATWGQLQRWWALETAQIRAYWYCMGHNALTGNWPLSTVLEFHYLETPREYKCVIIGVKVMRGKVLAKEFYRDSRYKE